jgi:hypothetical protein
MRAAALLASLILVCLPEGAAAQQAATAALSGRVVDAAGAVVPGAEVTARNQGTGVKLSTDSNNEGLFVFPRLNPGDYEITVQAPGFSRYVRQNLTLAVGQTVTLEATLAVGLISIATEQLRPGVELVNTTTPTVDAVIESRFIESLPLNGRNFLELALLTPGNARAPSFDPTKSNSVIISSAGQLGRGGNVTIDGVDNNDDAVGGPLENVSQEAVQEFQIATNRFSAEIGRTGSAVINVVTKSGTNSWHGSASFFERDQALQGLPATFDRSEATPPFDRQQYAGSIGGPIVKDKAWVFASFEYRDQTGAVLIGQRDLGTRSIKHGFAQAPLTDTLATARGDWHASTNDQFTFRYTIERAEDVSPSSIERPIGSASQRQTSRNNYQSFLTNYTRIISPSLLNSFSFAVNNYINQTNPIVVSPQLTFPSIQDGASFRVPQQTKLNRLQFSDSLSLVHGAHTFRFGGEFQKIDAEFDLGVFQQGRIEMAEDFPDFDRNGDGRVDDNDLLIAVTLRSATPTRPLLLPNTDNNYFAFFFQDDWRVHRQLALNLGLRYEIDTDVKNISGQDQINPIVRPFLKGSRHRDKNNFGPRIGFNWATRDGRTSIHGGYGLYYDRVTLEIDSLERGLDGRSLAIEVRAGNVFFLDNNGRFVPGAPTVSNPFIGFPLPGAGAAGIDIIDNDLQNPMVQQSNLGIQREFARDFVVKADYLHNFGTHFIIGRTIGSVFNPVVGGPDRVLNLESSVKTKYDGLLLSVEKRYSNRYQLRASYTLSKAFNYANDDQIPFLNGPVDPAHIGLEYGPAPNDQRHRLSVSGVFDLPLGLRFAPIWAIASGVPMDILLPDASSRIPVLQRNAGGRLFHTGAELNAFINSLNAAGGVRGQPLPLVPDNARFNDSFNSFDFRLSRPFKFAERMTLEPIVEVFNVFNVTNILGTTNVNYSGFNNALVRDVTDSASPGFLRSSSFGTAVSAAGGVFGSGGPRAFQFAARFSF